MSWNRGIGARVVGERKSRQGQKRAVEKGMEGSTCAWALRLRVKQRKAVRREMGGIVVEHTS